MRLLVLDCSTSSSSRMGPQVFTYIEPWISLYNLLKPDSMLLTFQTSQL